MRANEKLIELCCSNAITVSEMERLFAKGAIGVVDGWCAAAYCLCFHRNVECLRAYLRLTPSDLPLNAGSRRGIRPVHAACMGDNDDPKCLQELMAAGVDPSITTTDGLTPLMLAAGFGGLPKPRSVLVLLSDPRVAKAEHLSLCDEASAIDNCNGTAEEIAFVNGSEETAALIRTALKQAVSTAGSSRVVLTYTVGGVRRHGIPSPLCVTYSRRLVKGIGLSVGVR